MAMTEQERKLRATHAALTRWADPDAVAQASDIAKKAQQDRWERHVDPDGQLEPALRTKLADRAKRAHFADLARRSVKARRLRSEAAAQAVAS